MLAAALRSELVETAQGLERLGLLRSTAGNLSARVDAELLAITPSGMPYPEIEPADIVVCDLDGRVVEGGRRPSSELPFHTAVLRSRPDAGAVVHTHSPYATTLAVLGKTIPAVHYVVAALRVHTVPLVPYCRFGSPELAQAIADALAEGGDAALLANHGALALGRDLQGAAKAADLLEFVAMVYYRALAVGEPVVLPDHEIDAVQAQYRSYGQPPAGIAARSDSGNGRNRP